MPADEPPDEHAELRAIWEQHRAATFARVGALERAASLAGEGKLEAADRESARREAHTLAGAVAFFGYLDASRLASDLERAFQEASTSDPERLHDLVTELRSALEGLPYTL
ncbi:MAG TPA: Hpt domain-containing protein [Candidatus Limnocylindria bacterium]|jgi:HPt (histidine-containing phosphotransfer) domain-containing protein|nr:Hpt domain-containing protein [Candidatus Limnocylindria bacterium]